MYERLPILTKLPIAGGVNFRELKTCAVFLVGAYVFVRHFLVSAHSANETRFISHFQDPDFDCYCLAGTGRTACVSCLWRMLPGEVSAN